MLICIATVLVSSLFGLGRPVGGLLVFDEQGVPQRATMQVSVVSGGKIEIEHLVLRVFGPDGETRALHRMGYASSRKPLSAASAFWDEGQVRSMETLQVVASSEQVRSAVPALSGVESRLLHANGDEAVFERRDGAEVRVSTGDVVEDTLPVERGCRMDVTFQRTATIEGLIDPKTVPWPAADLGCPSVPPAGVQLFRSADAAFGEVATLLTLRDGEETRWQVSLPAATGAEEPVLLGALPTPDSLTIVATDDDALVFARLAWSDGVATSITRWR